MAQTLIEKPYYIHIPIEINSQSIKQTDEKYAKTNLEYTDNPQLNGTLGYFGVSTEIKTTEAPFPFTLLIIPYSINMIKGIDPISIRLFRWNENSKFLIPIWNSGVNEGHNFIWAKIRQPGIFVAIGLPSDPLLRSAIKHMAIERLYFGSDNQDENDAITKQSLKDFMNLDEDQLNKKRWDPILNTQLYGSTPKRYEIIRGKEGRIITYCLPRESLNDLRKRINDLKTPINGLPEEALFFSPEMI